MRSVPARREYDVTRSCSNARSSPSRPATPSPPFPHFGALAEAGDDTIFGGDGAEQPGGSGPAAARLAKQRRPSGVAFARLGRRRTVARCALARRRRLLARPAAAAATELGGGRQAALEPAARTRRRPGGGGGGDLSPPQPLAVRQLRGRSSLARPGARRWRLQARPAAPVAAEGAAGGGSSDGARRRAAGGGWSRPRASVHGRGAAVAAIFCGRVTTTHKVAKI